MIRNDIVNAIRWNANWCKLSNFRATCEPVYLAPHFGTPHVLHHMGAKRGTWRGGAAQMQNLPRYGGKLHENLTQLHNGARRYAK